MSLNKNNKVYGGAEPQGEQLFIVGNYYRQYLGVTISRILQHEGYDYVSGDDGNQIRHKFIVIVPERFEHGVIETEWVRYNWPRSNHLLNVLRRNDLGRDFTSIVLTQQELNTLQELNTYIDIYGYTAVPHSSRGGNKTRKKKPQFLYHPNNPDKSFDVYINKNPKDTIPIKYTTVKDVKRTIKKLEKLYKAKKYPHKRIWQVGMIMKVRLEVLKKKKPKQYQLSNRYFKHLGKRSKIKNKDKKKETLLRKRFTFKI